MLVIGGVCVCAHACCESHQITSLPPLLNDLRIECQKIALASMLPV